MNHSPLHAESIKVLERLRPLISGQRSAWLAGTRGESLILAPFYKKLCHSRDATGPAWWLATSEHGMALHQALDWAGIIPNEVAPQCHPAEEPAQRLALMLERAEAFGRQRKAQRLVFSGWGPTAVGAAIYCHARGGGGVWVRPPDPAGLIPRLRWEAGLDRSLRALQPAIEIIQLEHLPWWQTQENEIPWPATLAEEIPQLDSTRPHCLIVVMRREWGLFDETLTRFAQALGRSARTMGDWQFVVLSMLNARLERPLRTLAEPPANLFSVPPLPFPVYRELLHGCRAVLTDSPLVAAEARAFNLPVAALGETPVSWQINMRDIQPLTMSVLQEEFLQTWLKERAQ